MENLPSIHDIAAEARNRLKRRSPDNPVWFGQLVGQLASMESSADPEALIAAYLASIEHFYNSHDLILAIHVGERGLSLANQHDLKSQARQLCSNLGVLYTEVDQPSRAMPYLAQALQLAKEIGDLAGECRVWANLAKTLNKSGHANEAKLYARRALALAGQIGGVSDVKMVANQIIASASQHLNQYAEGLVAIRNAVREAPGADTPFAAIQLARLHCAEAKLLLTVGRFDEAAVAVDAAKKYAHDSGNDEASIQTKIVELQLTGTRDRAKAHATMATLQLIRDDPAQRGLRADVINALAYLAELVGDEDALSIRRQVHEYWKRKGIETVARQITAINVEYATSAPSEREEARRQTMETLAISGELHDDSTGEHCFRVGGLAAMLGRRLGLNEIEAYELELGARLHDIGKVAIADSVLKKPGKLNEIEKEAMRQHVTIGHGMLSRIDHPLMKVSSEIARWHHEWVDGTGYPDELTGEEIPLVARITAIADVFDALTHVRVYKEPWSVPMAMQEICSLRGTQFDPAVVDAFVGLMAQLVSENGESGVDAVLSKRARENKLVAARVVLRDALGQSAV